MMNLLTAFAILFTGVFASKSMDPVDLLKKNDIRLQEMLRKEEGKPSAEGKKEITRLINGIFNFAALGEKALGKKKYDSLSEEHQKRFLTAFQGMLENTSVKKLESYKADSTRFEKPKYDDSAHVSIVSHSFFEGRESVIEYKMTQSEGSWKAWDLVIDDLSTYRNYRDQFKKILKKKSMEDLIQILEEKAKDEEAPAVKDSVKTEPKQKSTPAKKTKK